MSKNLWELLDKFEPTPIPDNVRKAAEKFLTEKTNFGATANFAGFDSEGGIEPYRKRGCHAGISAIPAPKRAFVATENGADRRIGTNKFKDKSIIKPFLRWLLERSIYSKFILNRDNFDFCYEHGFIVSGDAPRKLFQNLMIITRHFYEVGERAFEKFNELEDKGFDPFICYMVCFNSYWSTPGKADAKETSLAADYGGHRASYVFTPDTFRNYLKGDDSKGFGQSYRKKSSIYGGAALFRTSDDCNLVNLRACDREFDSLILSFRETKKDIEKVKGYSPPNPFAPKADSNTYTEQQLNSGRFSNEELFEVYVPYLQRILDDGK